jgi:hypothetical protein
LGMGMGHEEYSRLSQDLIRDRLDFE